MMRKLPKLAGDEGGATAIEYGLIAGAVALAVLTAYATLGEQLRTEFAEIAGALAVQQEAQGGRGIVFGTTSERD